MTEAGRKSQGRLYSSDLIWNVTKLELKLDAWGDMHSQILDIPLVLFLASLIVQPCEYEYLYTSTCDRNRFLFIVCSCAYKTNVSICVMTRIFRGKITQKIQGLYKEIPNFLGNFTPKNLGHDADWDTINDVFFKNLIMMEGDFFYLAVAVQGCVLPGPPPPVQVRGLS